MFDELKTRFDEVVNRMESPSQVDATAVMRRGRKRGWYQRLSAVALVMMLAIAGSVTLKSLAGSEASTRSESQSSDVNAPAQQPGPVHVENPRVATFAVRALNQADLFNPLDQLNSYRGVEKIQEGWRVSFAAYRCDTSSCDPDPGGDTKLTVELDQGRLQVVAAEGPFSESQRAQVVGYSEEASVEASGLEFPFVELAPTADEGLTVVAQELWRGPIPVPAGVLVQCHLEVYDEDGTVIYQSKQLEQPGPNGESRRTGGTHSFGVPPEFRDAAASADVICRSEDKGPKS